MSRLRVLVVGSGGREHALAWKLLQSPQLGELIVAPGNAGTAAVADNVPVTATDINGLVRLVEDRDIDLTVVGPEAPLALGLADRLRQRGRAVFGPNAAGARIEASKALAKSVMTRAGVPTAPYTAFNSCDEALAHLRDATYPLVIKADGLAAGKGVIVCADRTEAEATVRAMMVGHVHGAAGEQIVIEEALEGSEVSVLALVDGETVVPLPIAQDHKRLGDGDVGPNTGGMGAYAPVPWISAGEASRLVAATVQPIATALSALGVLYRGVLYAGLMLTADGPRVLEYNCRFGDPEAQVILPLLADDLLPWLLAVARGELGNAPTSLQLTDGFAVGVTLATAGYPEKPHVGERIAALNAAPDDVLVFHSGTACRGEGEVVTAGGRVLTVVGLGNSLDEARQRAYSTPIHFPDFQMRTDIARPVSVKLRAGVLASGDGSNLQALLDASAAGSIDAEVVVVISGSPDAHALERARIAGVPAFALPFTGRRSDTSAREGYDRRLLDHLLPFNLDLLVLAGWMHVLSADFLDFCPFPVINVHPALLTENGDEEVAIEGMRVPVLRGMHAVRQAVQRRLPVTGVTVHRVTPRVDAGPIVVREAIAVEPDDCEETLYRRIKPIEHRLLVDAVRLVLPRR